MTDHASPRANVTVDWSSRESVRAKLRILRKYKYPPDQQEKAAQLVLSQAEGRLVGVSHRAIARSERLAFEVVIARLYQWDI